MSDLVYLTLNGDLQGLISAGCSSMSSIGNKAQLAHVDQIMVYALKHALSRVQNVNHQELSIVKPIDKSSPLLGKAISDNETLSCEFSIYRTNRVGMHELYYKIKLTNAHISHFETVIPHSVIENGAESQERVSFSYESITWEHFSAGTSAYSLWNERIF